MFCYRNWKEESIKTRIETAMETRRPLLWKIEKKNPLKQGLKLRCLICCGAFFKNWKEESIKTRIETDEDINIAYEYYDWKEESIKTRIETVCQ